MTISAPNPHISPYSATSPSNIVIEFRLTEIGDKLKIDDPVGAFPVHGLCGVWGGLATWLFGEYGLNDAGAQYASVTAQVVGSIAIPVFAFATMFVLFSVLKSLGVLRVSAEEEARGLDICEHGMQAYGA